MLKHSTLNDITTHALGSFPHPVHLLEITPGNEQPQRGRRSGPFSKSHSCHICRSLHSCRRRNRIQEGWVVVAVVAVVAGVLALGQELHNSRYDYVYQQTSSRSKEEETLGWISKTRGGTH